MKPDYQKILNTAIRAASTAGKYLKETFAQKPKIEYKGKIDLVTERDRMSQEMIYKIIKEEFPNHSVMGEENLNIEKDEELLWLIDPLDGTTNYAHSLPVFSVSIAFLEKGQTKVGVVYQPMLEEMFQAVEGTGAFLNNKKIKVSEETDLRKSLLATGFPYDLRESPVNNLDNFSKFAHEARAIRRCGSAAIDLSYAAAGRFDGFWELKLSPWDTAAALLFVKEAGGKITDFSGNPFNPFMKECLASNAHIHDRMLAILNR
ncbi:MAG: inositol monophosphatase [Candidatus Aminicenantes bacterium]|nr:inositol monophosphatase [Candidatus Aminicenantes bacterium]